MDKLKSFILIALFIFSGLLLLVPGASYAYQVAPTGSIGEAVVPIPSECGQLEEGSSFRKRIAVDQPSLPCLNVVPEIEDLFVDGVLTDVNVVSVELADGRLIDRQTQIGILFIFVTLLALTGFWMSSLHKLNHPNSQ